ncbi:response regulator [Deminuibacter soli]|nr:response regulator [Deminuibacter soli]
MKWIFIEDNFIDKLIAEKICSQHGVQALFYEDPAEAILAAQQLLPDVVLLDQFLPGANCMEVLHQLKAHALLKYIPVYILSAGCTGTAEEEALQAGAVQWLMKPFNRDYLHLISKKLHGNRAAGHETVALAD